MLLPPAFLLVIQLGSLAHLGCGNSRIVRVMPDGTVRKWKGGKQKISPDSSSKTQSDRIEEMLDARGKKPRFRQKAKHPHAHLRRLSGTSINPHAWGAYGILMYYVFFPLCPRA